MGIPIQKILRASILVAVPCLFFVPQADGQDVSEAKLSKVLERLDALEKENRELKSKLETVKDSQPSSGELLQSEVELLKKRLEAVELEKKQSSDTTLPPLLKPDLNEQTDLPSAVEGYLRRRDEQIKQGLDQDKPNKRFSEGIWKNGTYFETPDGAFKSHVGGRMDYDNTWYSVPDNMRFGSNNGIRLSDGTAFRRLRLRTDGTLYTNIDYALEINFANLQDFGNAGSPQLNGSVGVTDAYLTFTKKPFFFDNIRVGHQKPWFGLEHTTSDNYLPYMERSTMFDAFVNRFDYVNGVSAFGNVFENDRMTYGLGFMRSGSSSINPFGIGIGDGSYAYNTRFTFLPWISEDETDFVHIGTSYFFRALDFNRTSPGDRPLVRAGAGNNEVPNVIQTGSFYSFSGGHNFSPEIAIVKGPLSVSAEYLLVNYAHTYVEKVGTKGNPGYFRPSGPANFHGMYAETGYFLTKGDHRSYAKATGTWDRTSPKHPWRVVSNSNSTPGRGALELTARYTYLDLLAGNPILTTSQGARAGNENDMTLGLNWYLNPNARFMINYVNTWVNSIDPSITGRYQGLGMRMHFDF